MTVRTKKIGRTPTNHGPWYDGVVAGEKFCYQLFGCTWESLHDNNNTAPAVWDGADTITPNTTDWTLISGSYEAWLMNKDKPATTGTTGDYPYNGMGRVKLAKNIVNGVNTLTQDMFYKGAVGSRVPNTNTIFVIQYDYELAEDITIPDGCVLEFEGGSISGAYTLTGANTEVVVTGNYNPFSATLAGTFSQINPADKPYTSGNGMGIVYLKKNVSLASQLIQTNTIYVCQFDYTLAANITLPANSILRFDGGSIDSNYTITLSAGCRVEGGKITLGESGNIIIGADSVTIEGCEIHKDRENDGSEYSPTYQAIFANGKNYLTFKDNNIFLTNTGSFTTLISCSYVNVLNNHIKNTTFNPAEDGDRTCGVELCDSCNYVRIQGNTIENTNLPISAFTNEQKVTNLQILGNTILNSMAYGICIYDAANDASRPVENVVISGNIIKNVYGGDSYGAGIYLLESTNIVVSDNYIENTAVNTTVSGTLAPAGIGLNTSNHCTLSNNIIKTSKYYGIIAQGSNNLIQGNNIDDCPTSIEVRNLSYSRIENNIMNKNISVVSAITYVSIEQNTCLCIGWNYYATNGHNIHICRNILGSSGFDGFLLYINDNTTDVVIDGNIFDGDCSSAIWGSPTNSIYTNNVFLCTPTGSNMQYNGFGSGAVVHDNYIKNIKANDLSPMNYTKSGASSDRPAHPTFGMMYKDTTLNKPIWFDGTNWVDATGATV